jgi:hypothetical protein
MIDWKGKEKVLRRIKWKSLMQLYLLLVQLI